MKVRFFDPGRGYLKIKDEIDAEMQRVLATGDLILRADVEKFEENLANFVGTKYAVGLSSGTDALVLSLKALGIGKGDRVVLPAHTFKATCGAVLSVGAEPFLLDMKDTVLDVAVIRAWIPVHIAGERYSILAPQYRHLIGEAPIIEDAAQALGAVKNPTTAVQCWSFYPAKILGAFGDAGAITTNDENIADYIREARNHFKKDNRDFGMNSRLDNLQAAILNVKFKYLPEWLTRRAEIAEMYKALEGLKLPNYQEGRVWQDYIVRTPKRNELYEYLKEQGIETLKNEYPFSPEYPKPPLAKQYEAETLRLPIDPVLEDEEINYVIEKVNEFYGK